MLLLGLSSGHKLGLALVGAIFVGFSLVVSMLLPRWQPQFPGRGLRVFVALCVLLFVGMLAAVVIFAKESKSEAARSEQKSTSATTTTTIVVPTTTSTTGTTSTPAVEQVKVSESEWKVTLPATSLSAGKYTFDVSNQGKLTHNLTIKGPGVSEKTADLASGESAKLTVDLKPGTYDFYCAIPGHKQAGMDQKVTVS